MSMTFRKKIHDLVKFLIGLTGPKNAVKLRYLFVFKKLPNLKNPVTLNEKINAYKFMSDAYDFPRFADKVAVKDYVATKIGVEHIIPTIYAGIELPQMEERTCEMPYIIKMNNGCGWNIIVRNEKERDWFIIEKKIKKWSRQTFGKDTGEIHYSKIKPMVLVERFITEKNNLSPTGYKFYVLNGKAEFVELDIDKEKDPKSVYYDTEWNLLPFSIDDFPFKTAPWKGFLIDKPENFSEMLNLAEILSKDLPLVRIDFYNVNGHIYFGEMTLTPAAGLCYFNPKKYDYIYGEKLKLETKN